MSEPGKQRAIVTATSKPALPRHIKLRHDAARNAWAILAPERVLTPDAIAASVLRLCNGMRTVEDVAAELAQGYSAPKERILADIISMLQELADKGVVQV